MSITKIVIFHHLNSSSQRNIVPRPKLFSYATPKTYSLSKSFTNFAPTTAMASAFNHSTRVDDTCFFVSFINLQMFKTILCIGFGSFMGGILRYYISKGVQHVIFIQFPFGTMAVNLLGCFLIGLLYGLFDRATLVNPLLKLFLTVGFCGGFTTFSTFMNENFQLTRDGNILLGALYTAISLGGGFLLLALGHFMIKCYG